MTTAVSAYAATSATEPLTKTTITRRDVGPHDVAFDIHFAGICHSDIHTVRGEWGEVAVPDGARPRDRRASSPRSAPRSPSTRSATASASAASSTPAANASTASPAEEQYCNNPGMVGTYNGVGRDGQPTQGGYSGAIVVDENYVLRIPDAISAGGRRTAAVRGHHHRIRRCGTGAPGEGTKVAVIGLGGLGHLAVKLAVALGAEVTVLSQTLKKMEDGLRLGATEYYATSDRDTFKKLAGKFDLILNTVSANLDLGDYLSLLTLDGTLVELGMPEHPMAVPAGALIFGRRSIAGSMIGGIAETQEMLDFCAEHDVQPEIEVIAPDYINEAYERVLASDVRYRFVIDTASLR